MTSTKGLKIRPAVRLAFAVMAALLLLGTTAFPNNAQAQTDLQDPTDNNGTRVGDVAVAGNNTIGNSTSKNNVTVSVVPFVQAPGASVLVMAEGMAPNSNATITLGNVLIERETNQTQDGNASATNQTDSAAAAQLPGDDRGFTSIVAGRALTDENGTLLFAFGIPKEDVVVETTITDNSTGQETTIVDTFTMQGTLQVVVKDERGNTGHGEVTILAPVNNTGTNSTGSDSNSGDTRIG